MMHAIGPIEDFAWAMKNLMVTGKWYKVTTTDETYEIIEVEK